MTDSTYDPKKVFFNRLEEEGLTDKLADTAIRSTRSNLPRQIVKLIERGGCSEPKEIDSALACNILESNAHPYEELLTYFGIEPTKSHMRLFAKVPTTASLLEELKDDCILVPYVPMSIIELRKKAPELFYSLNPVWWYDNERFANKREKAGWHLLYKTEIPGSTEDEWENIIPANCMIPSPTILSFGIILHRITRGKSLFPDVYVRCDAQDSRGIPVRLGHTSDGLLGFVNRWGGRRGSVVGVAREYKL